MKGTKYKIKPNAEQQEKLADAFGCARFIYNWGLATKSLLYKENSHNFTYNQMATLLPVLKKHEDTTWLKDVHSQVLQSSLKNLDTAFTNFFNPELKSRYPKFKKKTGQQSAQFPQSVKIENNKIYIPKIGWMKIVLHRKPEGIIKTVTIKKDNLGYYSASVLFDKGEKLPEKIKHVNSHIALDMGINDFIVDNKGNKVKNPKFLTKMLPELRKLQRDLSRKVQGSNRYNQKKLAIAKMYKKISNARNDFQHKLSLKLVNENQVICIEDLSIKAMSKSERKRYARGLSDVGWYEFTRKLGYKLDDRGGHLIKIDRYSPSTKKCSDCDHVLEKKLHTKIREWICPECGSHHDRDINAALNIHKEGMMKFKAEGFTVSTRRGSIIPLDISSVVESVKREAPFIAALAV